VAFLIPSDDRLLLTLNGRYVKGVGESHQARDQPCSYHRRHLSHQGPGSRHRDSPELVSRGRDVDNRTKREGGGGGVFGGRRFSGWLVGCLWVVSRALIG
jgi:hypothetical protein